MIDELELAWEEDAGRRGPIRSHRRPRGEAPKPKKKKKRRRGRTVVALILAFVLLGAVGGGAFYGVDRIRSFFTAPDYTTSGTGEARVEVKQGQTIAEIGNTLYHAGVVKSAAAFVNAAKANTRSLNIQPGFYTLREHMRASDALAMLLDLKNRVVDKVIIPEGRSAKEIFALLSKATGIPVAQFEDAAKDPVALGVAADWFQRDDKKPVKKSIEGFLFPATYELNPDETAGQILTDMVNKFNQVADDLNFKAKVRAERHISPFEALIVASLAQAEAGTAADLGKVARVAYNRVYVKKMPLEFDATANYWLELQGKQPVHSGKLSGAELDDPKNPYNTKSVLGLPVGPISNPGEAALRAAMDPPKGDWLYFVVIDKSGKSAFTSSYSQHQKNIQTACANGVPLCGN